ncbi:hypothetical protein HMPREF9071_1266 [Capnocytophaga sp. oral taxon 338 str. F0234]|nr:hypothetical protein HMPREF9071_1266 [Capnocytophaga sp. oral taxon 338 str. F0234]
MGSLFCTFFVKRIKVKKFSIIKKVFVPLQANKKFVNLRFVKQRIDN